MFKDLKQAKKECGTSDLASKWVKSSSKTKYGNKELKKAKKECGTSDLDSEWVKIWEYTNYYYVKCFMTNQHKLMEVNISISSEVYITANYQHLMMMVLLLL